MLHLRDQNDKPTEPYDKMTTALVDRFLDSIQSLSVSLRLTVIKRLIKTLTKKEDVTQVKNYAEHRHSDILKQGEYMNRKRLGVFPNIYLNGLDVNINNKH